MAAYGSFHRIFDNPRQDNSPKSFLDTLSSSSPWNPSKGLHVTTHHDETPPPFTEIFGELHFRESSHSSYEKTSAEDSSLQLCTEGLGSESYYDLEDEKVNLKVNGNGEYDGEEIIEVKGKDNGSNDEEEWEPRRKERKEYPPAMTRMSFKTYRKFVNDLLPGWLFDDNYGFSVLGKIWILWHPSVKVVVLFKSLQMVTCQVLLPDAQEWIIVSIIYASNEEGPRQGLWTEIVNLASSQILVGKGWIVLGDFNQTLHPSEHSMPPTLNVNRRTREFRDCLLTADLVDLTFRGNTYTWWNKSKSRPVAKKLDRVLVNSFWSVSHPNSYALFGDPDFSDHASCGVILDSSSQKEKRPFKFYNFLLQNQDFLPLVAEHWFSFNVIGSSMLRVSLKLKLLKNIIRSFSRDNYSDLEKRVSEAHDLLLHLQNRTLASPTTENAVEELEAERKWHILLKAEESFFRQRSSISWIKDGDSNSAYFHRMVALRKSQNHIHYLYDSNDQKLESMKEIRDHSVDYFSQLLGGDVAPSYLIQSDMELLLPYRTTSPQNDFMVKMFSKEEIKEAFFTLPRNKTSGPDGYSSEFFISCWNVIGAEVSDAVLEFFKYGKLLKQWNATTLVLIPKFPNASKMSDFRPIACLNTVYKVISKLLSSRLKWLLPHVISSSQSAFMPGRLLAENVLLATEIVQGYNRKNIEPRAMLKVDIKKAFDSINWSFILSALKALGLPEMFIGWISECITTPTFSVSLNGNSSGYFKSSKGLRQGDPQSPYLFVLAMEVFSRLLQSRFEHGYINYHPKTSELSLSHLMFADDVMIFFDGSEASLHGINEALDDFASWSGLHINKDKTHLFYAGLNPLHIVAIERHGFPIASLPIRYLGLPLMHRKLRISEYEPLLNKIAGRFRGWAVKTLSFAGRTQLIASVISGTVNFWMSTFILPKGCIKKIESLCSRFLWSGSIDGSKGAKVAWATVCLPKLEGGLGLRRFKDWNSTLCLRFIWLLFSDNVSLWSLWHKFHNIKNSSFWEISESPTDSWTWKAILRLRPVAENFLKATVGNGQDISFWFDSWTPLGPLIKCLGPDGPRQLRVPIKSKVKDACNDSGWSLPSPRSDAALDLHIYLTTVIAPTRSASSDEYDWVVDSTKCNGFSSSRTWNALRPRKEETDWSSLVWFKGAIPKHAFNMWVSHLNRLPTKQRLRSWGIIDSSSCSFCSTAVESRDHLLITCNFSSTIWLQILARLDPRQLFLSWTELLSWIRSSSQAAPSLLRKIVAQASIYHIWKQRNNVVHNQIFIPTSALFKLIDRDIRNTINARRQRKRFRNLMQLWIS
ncbi:Reverse transcriptase domain [Arabidopsis thaliana x Arabidopsis arenosa]|uniref:Reverse transcriptase domain n=1 Tax=Arabidopsis thaliana x Arabidopsis arenosa TaxID=1240361 RepID=A0A8T1YZL9_9BRAS|nr:Reverse transcriptase domain [Arabidopsis thaliana x Arabidopsis arenosa]